MLWSGHIPSQGTQRNRRIRGNGTWGEQAYKLNRAEQEKLQKRRGSKGSWGSQTARLYREERQRQRVERRSRNLVSRLLG
jgi:hypothetical protein